jgi:hypothetical protein
VPGTKERVNGKFLEHQGWRPKTGDWKIPGQDKSEPLDGHSGVADVYSAMCGFVRYKKEKGEAPDKEMGLVFPKDLSPDRESLGDTDPKKWPKGTFSKEPEDPWRLTIELPFTDQDKDRAS